MNPDPTRPADAPITPQPAGSATRFLEIGLFLAAVLGHLPALGSWWAMDDWGQLGRAARLIERAGSLPPRVLSQHWWWDLTWPLFGLNPDPYALTRMVLHGLATLLVARIGRRGGLTTLGWFGAAAIFAATPLAFTPLYWASGIQELLAGIFALAAVDRWFAGGRRNLVLALGATVLSLLAKESGLGLPLFFLASLWFGGRIGLQDKPFAWALTLLMLLAAMIEGTLVVAHFATGPGDPYAVGGAGIVLTNLGTFGWWLLSPGPLLAWRVNWMMGAAGATLFLLWALWSWVQARGGHFLPAATLLAVLLVLGPALPLRSQIHPYLAYLAVAPLALALMSLPPRRWTLRLPVAAAICLVAAFWSFAGMRVRLAARNELGFPADAVVRATSLSWQASRMVRDWAGRTAGAQPDSIAQVALLQVPVLGSGVENSRRFGPRWVQESELYRAVGGSLGPALMMPAQGHAQWCNALTEIPAEAVVLAETATGFKVWGRVPNALLYAALTDVALGHYERARRHLVRAGSLHGPTIEFIYDEGQMIVPLEMALKNLQPFIDWTVDQLQNGSSRFEVGGLQNLFFDLLSLCTGRSVEELTSGSRLLWPGADSNGPPVDQESHQGE